MILKQKNLSELYDKSYHKNNVFEIVLIIIFAVITLIGILNHAMWRDELNGWLIARDSYSFINFLIILSTKDILLFGTFVYGF